MKNESIIISDLCPHHDENDLRTVSRYKRGDVSAVILTENFLKQTQKIKTLLLDYGSKGLCLGSSDALPYFRHIQIQLTFPGHAPFTLNGEVVYTKQATADLKLYRYGVILTENHQGYKDFILRDGLIHKLNNSENDPSN